MPVKTPTKPRAVRAFAATLAAEPSPAQTPPPLQGQNVAAAIDGIEEAGAKASGQARIIREHLARLEQTVQTERNEHARTLDRAQTAYAADMERLEAEHAEALRTEQDRAIKAEAELGRAQRTVAALEQKLVKVAATLA